MLTDLRTFLSSLDGPPVVGVALLALVLLWLVCLLANALAKVDRPRRVRLELGTNHDRLDAEAYRACTPVSSNRKAARR